MIGGKKYGTLGETRGGAGDCVRDGAKKIFSGVYLLHERKSGVLS